MKYKLLETWITVLVFVLFFNFLQAQNVGVGSTAGQSGQVKLGQTILVEIWVNNTSSNIGPVLPYKIKPQITFSESLHLADKGHELPTGWEIVSSEPGDVKLTNGTDTIPQHEKRIIKLAFVGKKISKGENVTTNLLFSNGKSPGDKPGPSLTGDIKSDNATYVTLKVIQ